ncbi:MAG: InlB B-repeat-containing protein [Planctomycetota bacterium]|jgi:hypothetical protein
MKRISSVSIVSLVFAFFVLGLASGDSALCRAQSHALLVQQTPSGAGMVSPEVGVHHFSCDSEVTLVAVPRPGYRFVYWLGDVLQPTASKTTALLDEPKIIIAVFEAVEEGQLIVGQNAILGGGGGGGSFSSGSSVSPAVNRTRRSSGGTSTPTNGGDPGVDPPGDTEDPGDPGEGDPVDPPDDPFDPPDDPIDPPDDPVDPPDPPDVPEPATGLMLTLGAAALLRKRRANKA